MSNPYVDWSKAPEGTTQVLASSLRKDGTPHNYRNWERVSDGVVFEWVTGEWEYYGKEHELTDKRIQRPLNIELTKKTFAVGVGDDEDLKKALDVIVAKYQGKLVTCKDYNSVATSHFKNAKISKHQGSFNEYINDLIEAFDRGDYFEIVDRNEQRKKEIQDQIEKLKEELDGL